MKKILLLLCTTALFNVVRAQQTVAAQANTAMLNTQLLYPMQQNSNILMMFNERYDGLEGNRFFYDSLYHTGKMHMTQGRNYFNDNYKYKFDQLAGTVQALRPDGKEILLDVNEVVMFEMFIEDKSVFFFKIRLPDNPQPILAQVIYAGEKMRLVRDIKKKLVRVQETGAYSTGKVYDQIKEDYQYYFIGENNQAVNIKPTKKGLIKAMPQKEKQIEQLFKQKKYNDLTVTKLAEIMQKLDEKKPQEAGN